MGCVREGVCGELRRVIGITDSTMSEVLLCIQLKKGARRCHPHPTYYGVRRLLSESVPQHSRGVLAFVSVISHRAPVQLAPGNKVISAAPLALFM